MQHPHNEDNKSNFNRHKLTIKSITIIAITNMIVKAVEILQHKLTYC